MLKKKCVLFKDRSNSIHPKVNNNAHDDVGTSLNCDAETIVSYTVRLDCFL